MKTVLCAALLAVVATTALAGGMDKKNTAAEAGVAKSCGAFFDAWNQHDVKAMMSHWADDATLINPVGRAGHGKSEIEAIIADEQSTVFKASTAKVLGVKVTRSLGSSMVLIDGEVSIDGAVGQDGSALPQMKFHMAGLMQKQGANWLFLDGRPYAFLPPPPAKSN